MTFGDYAVLVMLVVLSGFSLWAGYIIGFDKGFDDGWRAHTDLELWHTEEILIPKGNDYD